LEVYIVHTHQNEYTQLLHTHITLCVSSQTHTMHNRASRLL